MMMGIFLLPAYSNYWAVETRVNVIAGTLSRKRYKDLRGSIHLVDNSLKDEIKHDKLFKVRSLLEMVQANCLKVEPEVMSVDEQSIPAETRRSGIRQYNHKKPVKWGFKMSVRAGASGMMYDFFLYSSKGNVSAENCSSEGSVIRLVKHLPLHKHHTLCLDNWFTTIPLMIKLKALGVTAVGTIQLNRLQNCPLETDKGF